MGFQVVAALILFIVSVTTAYKQYPPSKCVDEKNDCAYWKSVQCKYEGFGSYRGNKSTTKYNTLCQRWDKQYPNKHTRPPHEHNFCRNPDKEPNGPWCYQNTLSTDNDNDERWVYCFHSCGCVDEKANCIHDYTGLCADEAYSTNNYKIKKTRTWSGIPCQRWDTQHPHKHNRKQYKHNICRNPDKEPGGPWCYTVDQNVRWQYCYRRCDTCLDYDRKCAQTILGTCTAEEMASFRPILKGSCSDSNDGCKENTYQGTKDVTVSSKKCQRWDSQHPHGHTKPKYSHNWCRNPDKSPKGPWCYTTDPKVRWEYCFPECILTS